MLTRPNYSETETKNQKENAMDAACDLMARTVEQSRNDGELTNGVVFNEYTAIAVLANIGVNVVYQNRGTLEEYIEWIVKELKADYDNLNGGERLKPFVAGGKEVTEEEMKKVLGIVEH